MSKGKLYLIPITLGDDAMESIPQYVIDKIHELDTFIVERARTARRYISPTRPPIPIQEITFYELDKRDAIKGVSEFLKDAEKGKDIGLMSEAGCPGVADPGALVVELAHQKGIQVVPLVGPSSILLALMASGMSGQQFCFHGYIPLKQGDRIRAIKRLEQESKQKKQTQIFIETPYRNMPMLQDLIKTLSPSSKVCVATDLSLETEFICSQEIHHWRKMELPKLEKRPTVFLISAYQN